MCNFRGVRGECDAYPHFLKWGVGTLPPTFKLYRRPSFELKLHRNALAAGALPRSALGS